MFKIKQLRTGCSVRQGLVLFGSWRCLRYSRRMNMRVMLQFNFSMRYPVIHPEEKIQSLFPWPQPDDVRNGPANERPQQPLSWITFLTWLVWRDKISTLKLILLFWHDSLTKSFISAQLRRLMVSPPRAPSTERITGRSVNQTEQLK